MSDQVNQPAFGTANLTNCERELIHLAASIQPHGVLLVLDEPGLVIRQVSANAAELFGCAVNDLIETPLARWSADISDALQSLLTHDRLERPAPFRCRVTNASGSTAYEAMVHRAPKQGLVLELEAMQHGSWGDESELPRRLQRVIAQITNASSVEALCDLMSREIRDLIGYDRVMVYRFDPDGHGEVVAEAHKAHLESYLGLHYPSSDIPQRARELYIKNRVRVLADTGYVAVPLVPRLSPFTRTDLDMSMSYLRSLSPLHIEYLRNMGVTGTLVTSLLKEDHLWGLVACHHYSPRRLPCQMRAACELLSEVFSTRLAALDAAAVAQSVLLVPRLEKQFIETASATGDWHQALFGALRALMPALNASGAALLYEGQTLTTGAVPGSEDLNRLASFIAEASSGQVFHSSKMGREPSFTRMTGVASGVLALRITPTRLDYMIWFRREQVQEVRWAGDPSKPMIGNDPNHLSPRRSFAVWTEQARNTAKPWTEQELAIAQLMQSSIFDTIQQVQGIRVLIVARQLASVSRMVERAGEPMVIFNERDRVLLINKPLRRLLGAETGAIETLEKLATFFCEPENLIDVVHRVRRDPMPWTGELEVHSGGRRIAMAVRADAVPSSEGGILGTIIMLTDLSERREAEAARRRLSQSLQPVAAAQPGQIQGGVEFDELMAAVLTNARTAVLSVNGIDTHFVPPGTVKSLESLTRRAAEVARQMMEFAAQPHRPD